MYYRLQFRFVDSTRELKQYVKNIQPFFGPQLVHFPCKFNIMIIIQDSTLSSLYHTICDDY